MRTRSYKAGEALGESIVEMVNLMYQNKTADRFLFGLYNIILDEMIKRKFKAVFEKGTPNTRGRK